MDDDDNNIDLSSTGNTGDIILIADSLPMDKKRKCTIFHKITYSLIGIIFTAYTSILIYLYLSPYQTNHLFLPFNPNPMQKPTMFGDSIPDKSSTNTFMRKGGWRDVEINTKDGITLRNYWINANVTDETVPQTILFFHGNNGRIVNESII